MRVIAVADESELGAVCACWERMATEPFELSRVSDPGELPAGTEDAADLILLGPSADSSLVERIRARTAAPIVRVPDAVLGEVCGRVAHDVRSPVGLVSGALAESTLEPPFSQLAERGVAQLRRFADRWSLIGDLLRDRLDLVPQPTDLSDLCEQVVRELSELESHRRLTVVALVDGPREAGRPGLRDVDQRTTRFALLEATATAARRARTTVHLCWEKTGHLTVRADAPWVDVEALRGFLGGARASLSETPGTWLAWTLLQRQGRIEALEDGAALRWTPAG